MRVRPKVYITEQTARATPAAEPSLPLREEAPNEAQVQALLEAWLDAKAAILAGKDSRIPLEVLARPSQLDRLASERDADQARGETQTISTNITKLVINERDANRIAATVGLSYTDQRLNAKGDPQGEPAKMELRNLYVFGRDGGIWPGPIRSHPEGACAMALQPSSVSRPLMS